MYWHAKVGAEDQLRRTLLRAERDGAKLQDFIDCAEMALACGYASVARALYGLAFLHVGFSRPARMWQGEVARRTGLWENLHGDDPGVTSEQGCSVDVALEELRRMVALRPTLASPPADFVGRLVVEPPPAGRPGDARRLVTWCTGVALGLEKVPELEAEGQLQSMLLSCADVLAQPWPTVLADVIGDDIGRAATLFALQQLRRFVFSIHDVLDAAPLSASFFKAAGRLDRGGLGPYFSNLRLIMRNVRDVFALIELACGEPARDEVERWCVLLSGHFTNGETLDLVDELGDRGMTVALRGLLLRIARWTPVEKRREIAWRIRDAALDIEEWGLAVEAQHLIALWNPRDAIEWRILGEINGSIGDQEAAEAAFARCLAIDPNDCAQERIAALHDDAFDRFAVSGGFGTSPGRRRLRRARLNALRRPA